MLGFLERSEIFVFVPVISLFVSISHYQFQFLRQNAASVKTDTGSQVQEVRGTWRQLSGQVGAKSSDHLARYSGIGTWPSWTHSDKAEKLTIAWVTWSQVPKEGQALIY